MDTAIPSGLDIVGRYLPAMDFSLMVELGATSDATTADDSMQIDQGAFEAQTAYAPPLQRFRISAQGAKSLKQYLEHGDNVMQPIEAQAIKSFVNGMSWGYQREILRGQLEVRVFPIEFYSGEEVVLYLYCQQISMNSLTFQAC